jgi:hypothetical protein
MLKYHKKLGIAQLLPRLESNLVEVALICALVREGGADVVHVDIDNDRSVSHLKDDQGQDAQTGQIHVLAVAPEGAGEEKTSLTWRSKLFEPRVYDSSLKYFMLQNTDMDGLGLPQDQVMLYCRPAFHSQFDFLSEQVLGEGHLGCILGPPGSGKSITAAAFALSVDSNS